MAVGISIALGGVLNTSGQLLQGGAFVELALRQALILTIIFKRVLQPRFETSEKRFRS